MSLNNYRKPRLNGVKIYEESKDEGKILVSSDKKRDRKKEYRERIKGTEIHEHLKACWRDRNTKLRSIGINEGKIWAKNNKKRANQNQKLNYIRDKANNTKGYRHLLVLLKRQRRIRCESHYEIIMRCIDKRYWKKAKNFFYVLSDKNPLGYPKGFWTYTMPHP